MLGMGIVLIAAVLVAWIVNPQVIIQYLFAVDNYPPSDWATPTIGGITRFLIGTEIFWLQFLPSFIGDWVANNLLVAQKKIVELDPGRTRLILLVSIFTAAYGWTSDQTASLIPILSIFVLVVPINFRHKVSFYIIVSYVFIEALLLLPLGNQLWNFWLAPALLVWYIISKKVLENQITY